MSLVLLAFSGLDKCTPLCSFSLPPSHPVSPSEAPQVGPTPIAPSYPQNHVNLVHRKGKTKVCPHPGCGKKFYLSNHLRRHMIIHSGQAPGRLGTQAGAWSQR